MELNEYVATVIEQICQGIINAQNRCGELGAIVNPRVTLGEKGDFFIPRKDTITVVKRRVQTIEIEASLSEGTSESQGGHLGLSVSFAGGKYGGDHSETIKSTNHVRFSVPVCLPASDVLDD